MFYIFSYEWGMGLILFQWRFAENVASGKLSGVIVITCHEDMDMSKRALATRTMKAVSAAKGKDRN